MSTKPTCDRCHGQHNEGSAYECRDVLLVEVERLQARVVELQGHLDWVGWSGEGVMGARAKVERLQEENAAMLRQWNDLDKRTEKRHREWSAEIVRLRKALALLHDATISLRLVPVAVATHSVSENDGAGCEICKQQQAARDEATRLIEAAAAAGKEELKLPDQFTLAGGRIFRNGREYPPMVFTKVEGVSGLYRATLTEEERG